MFRLPRLPHLAAEVLPVVAVFVAGTLVSTLVLGTAFDFSALYKRTFYGYSLTEQLFQSEVARGLMR